ncbi:MAG: phage tail protein [Clostridiales Family XIII bacterium]|jgi:phage-related protein|nr:phage tail protein [Clostridiales Family XIII bacterium]
MAASEIATAYVSIVPTTKGIKSNLSSALDKDASAAGDQAGEKTGNAFAGGLKKVAGVIAGAMAVAAVINGAKELVAGVIREFGALEQNIGGSEAVFGKYAEAAQKAGEDAYKNMGLSQSKYLETANKMGALMQGAGIETGKAFDLSSSAIQRTADVASVMGLDMDAAMESIAGAAKGNFTMMDNLGVAMNDTTLKAYALEKGVNFKWQTATNAQKTELAMQMFMERTAQYEGNFARESEETLSGSIGMVKAAFTNMLAGMGDANSDMSKLAGNLGDALGAVIENIGPVIQNIVTALPGILTALIPKVMEMWPKVMISLVESFAQSLPALIGAVIGGISSVIAAIAGALPTLIPVVVDGILNMIIAIIDNIPLLIDAAIQLVLGLVQGIVAALPVLIGKIPEIIQSLIDALIQAIPALIDGAIQLVLGIVTALPDIIMALINALPQIITAVVNGLITAIPQLVMGLIELVIMLVTHLPQIIVALIKAIPQIITAIVKGLKESGLPALLGAGADLIKRLWNGFVSWLSTLWTNIVNFAKSIPGRILEGLAGMAEIGLDLVRGLWDGISNATSWVLDKIKGFGKAILNGIKSIFGIKSPSKEMAKIGSFLDDGLVEGMQGGLDKVGAMSNKLSAAMSITPTVGAVDIPALEDMATGQASILTQGRASGQDWDARVVTLFREAMSGMEVRMDSGKLVGELHEKMDGSIGRSGQMKERGVASI